VLRRRAGAFTVTTSLETDWSSAIQSNAEIVGWLSNAEHDYL
jgi:hypothetical protein